MKTKKIFLLHFYLFEIIYRFFHIVISFSCCSLIVFYRIEVLLLLETYPFLKFTDKKFLVTHTTDLINLVWYLVFSTSFFAVFPVFFHQLIQFSKSSWYKYQLEFSKNLFIFPLLFYYMCIILCYLKLFPLVLNFLTEWKLTKIKTFLDIKIEFRILNYINWISSLKYCLSFSSYLFLLLIIHIWFLFTFKNIYKIMKFHRKKICFLSIFFLFILAPPDILLQFFILLNNYLFYEVVFFILCYKLCNSKN